MSNQPELKPCPFCGGKNLALKGQFAVFVQCSGCMAEGPVAFAQETNTSIAKAQAADFWNKRAPK